MSATNVSNVSATKTNLMHTCKFCNKELDTEKALWLHMKDHGIHHYFTSYHPSYLDQRRKHVAALPSGPQSDPKEPNQGNCLVLLSNGTLKPLALVLSESSRDGTQDPKSADPEPIRVQDQLIEPPTRGKFECKACNKVFNSHQALGGHRASHKKVKGCFAANVIVSSLDSDDNMDDPPPAPVKTAHDDRVSVSSSSSSKKPNKSHECSICHKVFPSGQALGGHKRCHWLPYTLPPPLYQTNTAAPPPPPPPPSPPQTVKFHNFFEVDESRSQNHGNCNIPNKKPRYTIISSSSLDLNPNPESPRFPSLGITNAGPTVTFLGSMTKKTKTSHLFQSRHCSYKCNTTLSLFNEEDSMPMEMQWKGKSSSWLHLGVASSTMSE